MNKIVKTSIYLVLALSSVVAVYLYGESFEREVVSMEGLAVNEDDFVRAYFKEGSEVESLDSLPMARGADGVEYQIESGFSALVSNLGYSEPLTLNFGNFSFKNSNAIVDIDFDGSRIDYLVLRGESSLLIAFSNGEKRELVIPGGQKVSFPVSKLDVELSELLRNKLEKELRYSLVPQSYFENDGYKAVLKAEDIARSEMKAEVYSKYYDASPYSDTFLTSVANLFTLVPEKRLQMSMSKNIADLNYAVSQALTGVEVNFESSADLSARLDVLMKELYLYDYGSDEWNLFYDLYFKDFENLEFVDQVDLLSLLWSKIDDSIAQGFVVDAQNAVFDYNDLLLKVNVLDSNLAYSYFEGQNALFYSLLLQHSEFHKDEYFSMKSVIEQKLYDVAPSSLRAEIGQSFIAEKLDFMKRLRGFFFDDLVDVQSAQDIYKRLMNEVREYLPNDQSGAAVIKLFERELSDVEDFWGYLKSPAYHGVGAGFSHNEKYQEYLADRQAVVNLTLLREEIFDEVVEEEVTLLDVQDEIENVFSEHGVEKLKIGEISDVQARFVEVEGEIGGYPFSATYDRFAQNVQDVYVFEEQVASRATSIENLLPIFQENFAEVDVEVLDDEGEQVSVESIADRHARDFVAKSLVEKGFAVAADEVENLYQGEAIYRVKNATLAEDEGGEVRATFDMDMTRGIVLNVLIYVDGDLKNFSEEYDLDELSALMQTEFDFINRVEDEPGDGGGVKR